MTKTETLVGNLIAALATIGFVFYAVWNVADLWFEPEPPAASQPQFVLAAAPAAIIDGCIVRNEWSRPANSWETGPNSVAVDLGRITGLKFESGRSGTYNTDVGAAYDYLVHFVPVGPGQEIIAPLPKAQRPALERAWKGCRK